MQRKEVLQGNWRKSRYCDGGSCVEIMQARPGLVAVRDSVDPAAPPLVFTSANWRSFTEQAKRRAFDLGNLGPWRA